LSMPKHAHANAENEPLKLLDELSLTRVVAIQATLN